MSDTPDTLTVTQTHQLLDKLLCKKGSTKQFARGLRNYTMALTMLEAGLRVGELVHLRISDLWFAGAPVTNIIIRPEISKTKEERSIPVSTWLSNAIAQMSKTNWSTANQFVNYWAFGRLNLSKPLTTRQVERIINGAAVACLGFPVHPHVLRHTFASKLMRVTDIRTVQELLGHKSVLSTQIYTHPNEDDKKKAILNASENNQGGSL